MMQTVQTTLENDWQVGWECVYMAEMSGFKE